MMAAEPPNSTPDDGDQPTVHESRGFASETTTMKTVASAFLRLVMPPSTAIPTAACATWAIRCAIGISIGRVSARLRNSHSAGRVSRQFRRKASSRPGDRSGAADTPAPARRRALLLLGGNAGRLPLPRRYRVDQAAIGHRLTLWGIVGHRNVIPEGHADEQISNAFDGAKALRALLGALAHLPSPLRVSPAITRTIFSASMCRQKASPTCSGRSAAMRLSKSCANCQSRSRSR